MCAGHWLWDGGRVVVVFGRSWAGACGEVRHSGFGRGFADGDFWRR